MLIVLAVLIGIVAGLRAFTAPAAVSLAVHYGSLSVAGTRLAFLGYRWTPWILVLLALAEFVGDKLPATPSRKVPLQFGTRIVMGALAGGAIAVSGGLVPGAVAGAAGAVIGTLGGAAVRAKLAAAFRHDRPAALIEDVMLLAEPGCWRAAWHDPPVRCDHSRGGAGGTRTGRATDRCRLESSPD